MESISFAIIVGLTALLMVTITGIGFAIIRNIRSGAENANVLQQS